MKTCLEIEQFNRLIIEPLLFWRPLMIGLKKQHYSKPLQSLVYIVNILVYIQLWGLLYMCLKVHGFYWLKWRRKDVLFAPRPCQIQLSSYTRMKIFEMLIFPLQFQTTWSCGFWLFLCYCCFTCSWLRRWKQQPASHRLLTVFLICACCVKSCFYFECSQNALWIIWCVHFLNME